MKITVHRGCNEIGGTCIELVSKGTKILLDIGRPLIEDDNVIDISKINPDAVIISHSHQDHYGLVDTIDPDIPVFIGELGKKLIDTVFIFTDRKILENNFKYFKNRQKFKIGEFEITPYAMDHSAVDSYGFLIEVEGKRIFYSGDFRGHGRKKRLFDNFITDPPETIDILFMEGTMIESSNDEFPTEDSVEDAIKGIISNQENISFLICSSQNIDRIVSAYRACLKADKTLVIDVYTAWVLEQMRTVSKRIPNIEWKNVRVYIPFKQYEIISSKNRYFAEFFKSVFLNRIKMDELLESPGKYVYIAKSSSAYVIKNFICNRKVNVIYSQWLGYLEEDNRFDKNYKKIARFQEDSEVNFSYAHTSGHAVLEDLKHFAKAINPRMLVPIHTDYLDEFKNHFSNVYELDDEKELEVE